jgi:hypothetical protein
VVGAISWVVDVVVDIFREGFMRLSGGVPELKLEM